MTSRRKRYRILVVDDDHRMRDLIDATLTRSGFMVMSVPNGLKLVSFLQTKKPDLIILDAFMSWISGFDLCRLIKNMAGYEKIPIMFISGYDTPENVHRAYECGAIDFLAKPFQITELVKRVKTHIGLLPAEKPST